MFEEFKKIDSRVIRPVNGNEFFVTNAYINVMDIFPKFSAEEFKERAQENLSKIEVFNLALKKINNFYFWIKKPFKIQVQEVEWKEEEEFDNYLKNERKIIIPFEPLFDEEEKDVLSLYKFRICQLKNNKTKLTFSALHPVSDGRTVFTMFDLVRKIIDGETLDYDNEPLPSFSGRELFQNLDSSVDYDKPPAVWNEISPLNILPKLNLPYQYITLHYLFDYAPIKKYCKENNVTVQAMLIAMLTRATRKYKNLPKETPLWNGTPRDTRFSPYATEEYKNQKFYCHSGEIFPCVVGQDTLLEDLKHCTEKLREAKKSNSDVVQILSSSKIINPETLQFIPNGRFPDSHHCAVVSSSNIGKVNGNKPLFYLATVSPFPDSYVVFYHSYHTDDTLFVSGQMPVNLDEDYIKYIEEEMNSIFIPENIEKKDQVPALTEKINDIKL